METRMACRNRNSNSNNNSNIKSTMSKYNLLFILNL